jgi:hypothetical protein
MITAELTEEPAPRSGPGRAPFGFRFVAPLALGSALNPINSTMISTALVPIAADLARHGSRHYCITSTLPRSKGHFGGRDARPVQGSIG